jgi:hypothetical protein
VSQYDFSTLDAEATDGYELATVLNSYRDAVNSNHKGASRPSYAVAGMVWIKDVSSTIQEIYVYDGSQDIQIGLYNPTSDLFYVVDKAGAKIGAAEVDIASATTTDLGTVGSDNVRITGTTTITGLGTVQAGVRRYVRFAGALTLTHNGTSLILPGGISIGTNANDRACFVSLGSGNWLCLDYVFASGAVLANGFNSREQSIHTNFVSTSTLSTQQNDFAPTGIGSAHCLIFNASADVSITGINATQVNGRLAVQQQRLQHYARGREC